MSKYGIDPKIFPNAVEIGSEEWKQREENRKAEEKINFIKQNICHVCKGEKEILTGRHWYEYRERGEVYSSTGRWVDDYTKCEYCNGTGKQPERSEKEERYLLQYLKDKYEG